MSGSEYTRSQPGNQRINLLSTGKPRIRWEKLNLLLFCCICHVTVVGHSSVFIFEGIRFSVVYCKNWILGDNEELNMNSVFMVVKMHCNGWQSSHLRCGIFSPEVWNLLTWGVESSHLRCGIFSPGVWNILTWGVESAYDLSVFFSCYYRKKMTEGL